MDDFIIVGAGVSGGRFAYELTKAGAKCTLLEAGRDFNRETFPKNEMDYSTQMFWGGGLELNTQATIGFLRARCVGGTSIVNQALLDRFDDFVWEDWHDQTGISFFDGATLDADYAACESSISIQSIPRSLYNTNAEIALSAFDKKGYRWKPLSRGQSDCKLEHGSDCIVCLGGCPRDSKQSSLVTTIRRAREMGLKVVPECEVDSFSKTDAGFEVRARLIAGETSFKAKKLVLASGSFGNVSILLRSGFKKKIPSLGKAFSCHPQYMTYGVFDKEVNAHKGAFQAIKSDDLRFRKAGFKFENVFAPPVGTSMILPGIGAELMRSMAKYRHFASMEIAARDEATGEISLSKDGRPRVVKNLTAQDRSRIEKGLAIVRECFETAGAREVITCPQAFGLHLMGGCSIGSEASQSVVNPEFELHACPGVFVADSSIFPAAPGINPSLSIMAFSHRASTLAAKRFA